VIDGVKVIPLRQIPDERGAVLHMLRSDDPHFEAFGEIYFSSVVPGAVKAWRRHREMVLFYAVPVGLIRLVLYDDRADSPSHGQVAELLLGDQHYALVRIPALVWSGFKGLGSQAALVANCATIPHRADEVERREVADAVIPYDWSQASR
jgi:dTDP-4-dehydrorhamnose 3,5-epimerase